MDEIKAGSRGGRLKNRLCDFVAIPVLAGELVVRGAANMIRQEAKHALYHLANVEHLRIDDDGQSSFYFYVRIS